MKNIKKSKKIIISLILVLLIGICVFIFINSNKNGKSSGDNKKNQGYKLENKLTAPKRTDEFEINNIIISKTDKQIFITADVTNITKNTISASPAYLIALDKNNKEISRIKTLIPTTKSKETTQIKVDVTDCYGDARNFKLERK